MATIGIELCDAGFYSAACDTQEPRLIEVADTTGATEWPGYAFAEGSKFTFGRAAEDMWFVHPRRVTNKFWSHLTHEPSALNLTTKPPSFSQLAYFFLRDYIARLNATATPYDQMVLALPSAYLKNEATEDEKVGLLLGMAGELKLPLAGMIDMACAALCDPRASGFNPALPVVVVDLNLDGAELTLFSVDEQLTRRDFIHLPQLGLSQLLKQITGTMGNRFLRHTAFDILEDGRIEQTFFRQTKEFVTSQASEYRFHINTATRAYEMVAKREQLASDASAFATGLVQGIQAFVRNSPHGAEPCTIALTDRAAQLPGIEPRLRTAGLVRILRLPRGAAASGAACIGAKRLKRHDDLGDVPVLSSVPLAETRRLVAVQWEARLQKNREPGTRLPPTHAILGGLGHVIGRRSRFTIGTADLGADLPLPDSFSAADHCTVPLLQEDGRLWFVDAGAAGTAAEGAAARSAIDAGDRLSVRCGSAAAEILFAHCPSGNGSRMD